MARLALNRCVGVLGASISRPAPSGCPFRYHLGFGCSVGSFSEGRGPGHISRLPAPGRSPNTKRPPLSSPILPRGERPQLPGLSLSTLPGPQRRSQDRRSTALLSTGACQLLLFSLPLGEGVGWGVSGPLCATAIFAVGRSTGPALAMGPPLLLSSLPAQLIATVPGAVARRVLHTRSPLTVSGWAISLFPARASGSAAASL
ncbi:hypothetical protein NDU88_001756 [Pleurodeles waltl]|uniref:Uncharacterized protein n=1 Tax=Pleurodeles waltl TaxID=8319 RepID=A0AAV7UVL7_PLEWA|nr:hypothetical protein NDU88_001756 [Pleurodeles waltl]